MTPTAGARVTAAIAVLALVAAGVVGCQRSLGALHGVGAASRAETLEPQPALAADGVRREAVTVARAGGGLDQGIAINVANETAIKAGEPPPAPELGANREEAIGQIRGKASAAGKTKPDIFAPRYASAAQLGDEELARLEKELQGDVAATQGGISGKEAAAREAAALRLKRRAATHYKEALSTIEK